MQRYIVQDGDTLYGISKQYGISVEDIKLANNLNNNNIVVGESLYLNLVIQLYILLNQVIVYILLLKNTTLLLMI